MLAYYLTGVNGAEHTIAITTQLYNPTTRDWDWGTVLELEIPEHIFTPVKKTGTIRGYLRNEFCDEIGINPAAFIAVEGHDTASAVAAIPGGGSFAFCFSSSGGRSDCGGSDE